MSNIFDALKQAAGTRKDIQDIIEATVSPLPSGVAMPLAGSFEPKESEPVRPAYPTLPYRVEDLRLSADVPAIPFDGSAARAAEQYRLIRTRLQHHPRTPKILLVSSPTPGDGKTITAVNLAAVLALKSDSRALLVDADLRRPTIGAKLGISDAPGLGGVLEGTCSLEEAIIKVAELPSLYVLPTGKPRMNPTELLDSPKWAEVVSLFRERFEYCVIDSPPVSSVADYELLEKAVDGVIVVVRPDHTNRSVALKVLETIPRDKQLGLVVNCATEWILFKPPFPYYYYGSR